MTLLEKLDNIAKLQTGDPPPEWLADKAWGTAISQICREAAREIRFLRSTAGAVSQGQSFNDIAKQIESGVKPTNVS